MTIIIVYPVSTMTMLSDIETHNGLNQTSTTVTNNPFLYPNDSNPVGWYGPAVWRPTLVPEAHNELGTWVPGMGKVANTYVPAIAPSNYPVAYSSTAAGVASGIMKLVGGLLGFGGLFAIAVFAYRIWIMKRVNRGDEPGIIGKLVMPETWEIWGNQYQTQSNKIFAADDQYYDLGSYIDEDGDLSHGINVDEPGDTDDMGD